MVGSIRAGGGSTSEKKNLSNSIIPIALNRIVQTIGNWRAGTVESEQAYYPYRVKMQQLYNDLQDEPHTSACMERRYDLTLMRDYMICNANGKEYTEWTKWLKKQAWFIDYQRYVLSAIWRGYALVSIGDIIDNALPELKLIENSVISPDRKYVGSVIYMPTGISWEQEPYDKWHIYVSTTPEIGRGVCGYGILHKIAVPVIILRNNLSDNATFNERFGMPVTWGKTDKTDDERADFFQQLRNMGASATFVTDLQDELQFVDAKGGGNGYKTYADLEMRCQKLISKNSLGHADVMDSIPKKSGGAEGNSSTPTTPVAEALSNIRSKDGKFVETYNNKLLELLKFHGVGLPADAVFCYKNDDEIAEGVERKNYNNQVIATIAKTMKDAGLQPDPTWFTKATEIPCSSMVSKPSPMTKEVQNKLNLLYSNHKHGL
jgi:hypothetical protein